MVKVNWDVPTTILQGLGFYFGWMRGTLKYDNFYMAFKDGSRAYTTTTSPKTYKQTQEINYLN